LFIPNVVGFANLAHIGVLHFMPTGLAKLNFAVKEKISFGTTSSQPGGQHHIHSSSQLAVGTS